MARQIVTTTLTEIAIGLAAATAAVLLGWGLFQIFDRMLASG